MDFKEKLFLFLSGIFLTSLVLANIIGTTKFVIVFGLTVPAGVLAYPFTFLATDLICELYGKKRAQAFWTMSGIMGFLLLIILVFALPHYGKYFINPPQELASIAGMNLESDDTLIQYGTKRPSLSFYAKRKVHFISPGEDKLFAPHLKSKGRMMILLQANLFSRLPHPISQFTPILQRYGWLLLSSESLVH